MLRRDRGYAIHPPARPPGRALPKYRGARSPRSRALPPRWASAPPRGRHPRHPDRDCRVAHNHFNGSRSGVPQPISRHAQDGHGIARRRDRRRHARCKLQQPHIRPVTARSANGRALAQSALNPLDGMDGNELNFERARPAIARPPESAAARDGRHRSDTCASGTMMRIRPSPDGVTRIGSSVPSRT